MEYLLALLAAALGAFVALLLYFDLAPKTALNKIVRRFIAIPDITQRNLSDAPYRQIRRSTNPHAKPTLLNIQTSEGSGQAAHPDVAYSCHGFGALHWPYWMVCTPYPYGNSLFENPELFASFDGQHWEIPHGARNPLLPSPPLKQDHNSDPDIVFHDDELWLFFRETVRSKTPTENRIYAMNSRDGKSWTQPREILLDRNGTGLLSPAVIHDGNGFAMWTIEKIDGRLTMTRRTSGTGAEWSEAKQCQVAGVMSGRNLWHIDVLQESDRLSALIVTCTGPVGEGSRLHYAHSFDGGDRWFVGPFILEQVHEFEAALQYRATLRRSQEDPALYQVWYSAASSQYMWSIAYLQFVREGNNFTPYFPCGDLVRSQEDRGSAAPRPISVSQNEQQRELRHRG